MRQSLQRIGQGSVDNEASVRQGFVHHDGDLGQVERIGLVGRQSYPLRDLGQRRRTYTRRAVKETASSPSPTVKVEVSDSVAHRLSMEAQHLSLEHEGAYRR